MPGPVFLEGETVSLRTFESEDVEWSHELVNHPNVWGPLGVTEPTSLADAREWFESSDDSGAVEFVVSVDETPVGTIRMKPPDEAFGVAELAYKIHPDHWGNGYATDAIRTICGYAFETRRLEKLYAVCFDTNPGSASALETAGFTQEGRLRKHWFTEGERVDVLQYGLLATEWFDEN
ncbi:GNAT family N-acetyltransferase [Halocatena halophila]|uniref:GNAT family N-acetyltransferase n=1 Tax=Halocatena halophila TaxID=2814576 RepID=UPI002ED39293